MSGRVPVQDGIELHVENVGGITETQVAFEPGITALAGRNATNRTSLLQAIMAVCGSDRATLRGDADDGRVEMRAGDETYTRTLVRREGQVTFDGDPLLTENGDVETAELFAFLLESNEARQAIAAGGESLRDLIMRPIDTGAIEAEIERLEHERDEVTEQLGDLDRLADRLPELEEERSTLTAEIEALTAEIESLESELEETSADVETERDRQAAIEDTMAALNETRSAIEDVRYDLETEREKREELEAELESKREALSDLPDTPAGDAGEIDATLERKRSELADVDTDLNQLRSLVQFNEKMLDGGVADVADVIDGDVDQADRAEALTAELVDDEVACWTCGSRVERDAIETTLDRLRDVRTRKQEAKRDLREEIQSLQEEREELASTKRERERLDRSIQEARETIDACEDRIADLQEERETLQAELAELEDEVEELDTEGESEVLDLHKQINQLEFERGQRDERLTTVEAEIEEIEDRLSERDAIEGRLDEIEDELRANRGRVESIEADAVEAFNDHMETVLDRLAYENVERIWIERVERDVRRGRERVSETQFELHVVRSGESGVYEDTLDTLSESEREVTGLVFSLAGYLVHDVHETVPLVLVDSLEAVDAPRIADVLEHFADHAAFVIAPLLPEDAVPLEERGAHIVEAPIGPAVQA